MFFLFFFFFCALRVGCGKQLLHKVSSGHTWHLAGEIFPSFDSYFFSGWKWLPLCQLANQVNPLPSLSFPWHCLLVKESWTYSFFKSSCSSFSFNHKDISINVSLRLYYIDDFAFKAGTGTVNNTQRLSKKYKKFSSQNWKMRWHFWLLLP